MSAFPVKNPAEVVTSPLPATGPYYHTLRTASSTDGLIWTDDRTTDLALHVSVPSVAEMDDGTIIIYFVDFSSGAPEKLGCVISRDGGKTYTWGPCSLEGLTSNKAVDFAPFGPLNNTTQLYFYASSQDVNSTGLHNIDVAESNDGRLFTRKSTVFTYPGLVDPDVFYNGSL